MEGRRLSSLRLLVGDPLTYSPDQYSAIWTLLRNVLDHWREEKKINEQTQNNRGWPVSFLVDRI